MARRRHVKLGDLLWTAFNYTALGLLAIVCVYPFLWVAASSVSDPDAVVRGAVVLWPVGLNLATYKYVFGFRQFWTSYGNTLFYVVVGTTINVVCTMIMAYPLSRTWFRGRGILTAMIVFTMFFSGGMIPTYLVVRLVGLVNTRWAMIIPGAVGVWEVIMARAYLTSNIPDELVEAAEIDGANDLHVLWSVVLPLSGPIIAVLTVFYAVGHWNDYFSALLYLTNQELVPLQIVLRQIVAATSNTYAGATSMATAGASMTERAWLWFTIRYASIMVATVPIMAIYPFLQRYFVKGALLGSLKG